MVAPAPAYLEATRFELPFFNVSPDTLLAKVSCNLNLQIMIEVNLISYRGYKLKSYIQSL